MLDLGWTELLVIGVVALIVVGPKDLPVLFRKAGQFVGKMRGMAREFTRAMNDAADQTGVREATDSFKGMSSGDDFGLNSLKKTAEELKSIDPDSATAKLAAERAEAAEKIHAATAKRQAEKRAAEQAADTATPDDADSAPAAPATPDEAPAPTGDKA